MGALFPSASVAVTLLRDDVEYSNKPELARDGRNHTALLCQTHFNQYEVACFRRKCTIPDCFQFGTRGEEGIPMCSYYQADRALTREKTKSQPNSNEDREDSRPSEENVPRSKSVKLNKRVLGLLDPHLSDRAEAKQS